MRDPDAPAPLPQVGGDIYDELVRRLGYQPQVAEPAAPYGARPEPTAEASLYEPSPFEPSPFEPSPVEPSPVEPSPVEPSPVEPSPFEPSPFGGMAPEPSLTVPAAEAADDEPSPFGADLGADLFEGAPADDVWDADPLPVPVADRAVAPVLGSTVPDGAAPGPLAEDRSSDPFYATLPAMPPLATRTGRA